MASLSCEAIMIDDRVETQRVHKVYPLVIYGIGGGGEAVGGSSFE